MQCSEISTTSWTTCTSKDLPFFDLQLFSDEKTEEATPKRKQEARNRGQVAKSVELNAAFVVLAAFYSLKVLGPYIYEELMSFMRFIFSDFSTQDFTNESAYGLFLNFLLVFIKTALPVMAIIALISLIINFCSILNVGVTSYRLEMSSTFFVKKMSIK